MTAHDIDIDLPPLPEWMNNYTIPSDDFEHGQDVMLSDRMHDYAREVVRLNACESRASTHADDCWSWGPGHYKCAVKEIKTLQAKCDALREALEAMLEIHGVTQHYADTHIEIPQSWVEVSELARAALSGESNAL